MSALSERTTCVVKYIYCQFPSRPCGIQGSPLIQPVFVRKRIASAYPSNPIPANVLSHTAATYDVLRKYSRSAIFVKCTYIAGIPTAFSASGIAMLVCV